MYIPVKDREVDLAKAKQLLAEAGYPRGFKTEFLEYSGYTSVGWMQAVAGQLQKIGIEATIKVVDRAPYFESSEKGRLFHISLRGDSERLDPDDAYYLYLHSGEIDKNN